MNYYEKFALKEVINASGKMTILGVSKVSENVMKAQQFGDRHFFEMEQLTQQTGNYIAKLLNVEAAVVVSSASAGIAQSVAAMIGQGSIYHLYHPYDLSQSKREIILPKGHNVDYGTAVEVMIAQGGGMIREAGYANMCQPAHISCMITAQTAAIVYIKSHHAVQKSMLTVKEAAMVAHENDVPLIVDAAAEEDLFKYIKDGADLVIYSGAKALEGPSSGLVIGKKKYVDWVRQQSKGLGRSMKVGKENILGLTSAIEHYTENGSESGTSMKERLRPFLKELNLIPHVKAEQEQDAAGRDIYRAKLTITGEKSAKEVVKELKAKSPAVYTREYRVNTGIIECDIRAVNEQEMAQIILRLKEIME